MNRVHCQKQQQCHLHIFKLRFVKAHKDVSKDRSKRRTHGYSINLIIKLTVKNKMSLRCSEKEKFFKFFSSDVQIRIMIEKEIYCYVNGFLKWNISKKTSYVIGNKKFFGKICILNLRNKRKSIFARVIIRNERRKKITTEMARL